MDLWPFRPVADAVETLEWKTEIIYAQAAEQRIALRATPRVQYSFKHVLNQDEYQSARFTAINNETFTVPDWFRQTALSPISAGINVVIPQFLGLVAGDVFLVWESETNFEYLTVASVASGNMTIGTVVNSYQKPIGLRIYTGFVDNGFSFDMSRDGLIYCNESFKLQPGPLSTAGTYSQYKSVDICPIEWRQNKGIENKIVWPTEVIDNSIGLFTEIRTRDTFDSTFNLLFLCFGTTEIEEARKWLMRCNGRQKAFWLSSQTENLKKALGTSGNNKLRVYQPTEGVSFYHPNLHIELVSTSGTKYQFKVNSCAESSVIGGKKTLELTLDANTPILSFDQISKISWLYFVRLNNDRIEIQWGLGDAPSASISVNCMEVPA